MVALASPRRALDRILIFGYDGPGLEGGKPGQDSRDRSALNCPAGIRNAGTSEPSTSTVTARSPVDSLAGTRKTAATVAPGVSSIPSEHDRDPPSLASPRVSLSMASGVNRASGTIKVS